MFEQKKINQPVIMSSLKIIPEHYDLCKKNNIKLSEAFKKGLFLILAEKGIEDYEPSLDIYKKMVFYKEEFQLISQKYTKLLEEKTEKC